MPIYQYACLACKHEFSDLKSIEERNEARCPECGGGARKLISPARVKMAGPDGDTGYKDVLRRSFRNED